VPNVTSLRPDNGKVRIMTTQGRRCQEIQRREDLEIPIRACFEVVGMRVGKGLTSLLLGFVDHLPSIGYLDQPRQTERATNHVLY
jgi:hypothetical protein